MSATLSLAGQCKITVGITVEIRLTYFIGNHIFTTEKSVEPLTQNW